VVDINEQDPSYLKAVLLVDRSIKNKGEVASLPTTQGNVRSFEDSICPAVYEGYLALALEEVDAGNWQTAFVTARSTTIERTLRTINNQG
jgi:hypothetical protein